MEKLNGLPLSPNMDRDVHNQPSISTGFIDFLVKPFFEAISHILPETSQFLGMMTENRNVRHSFIRLKILLLLLFYYNFLGVLIFHFLSFEIDLAGDER